MAKTFAENVVETSNTIGTDPYELAGSVLGHRSFSDAGFVTGDKPTYVVRNRQNTKYEFNKGANFTNSDPDTLARGTYLSSNANNPVVWAESDRPLTIYIPTLNKSDKKTRVQSGVKTQLANVVIPADNTIPQNNEGAAFTQFDLAVVIESVSSKVQIKAKVHAAYDGTAPAALVMALFMDSGADAISVASILQGTTQQLVPLIIDVEIPNPGLGAHTFKIRIGSPTAASNITVNGANNVAFFNEKYNSFLECIETFDV